MQCWTTKGRTNGLVTSRWRLFHRNINIDVDIAQVQRLTAVQVSMQRLTPSGATWDVYRVGCTALRSHVQDYPFRSVRQPYVDALQCHKDELPDLETVDQYIGIFVSGSHCSANETEGWIQQEAEWLRAFTER